MKIMIDVRDAKWILSNQLFDSKMKSIGECGGGQTVFAFISETKIGGFPVRLKEGTIMAKTRIKVALTK